ncbi:Fic family protein [Leucothrix arctica]|uniref:Cell filamentation protein Fic n=1 Tax=Leucothrix arctica TaxID=1481894 RepID=A0A317C808_9GAMM|nr:Fic family protein [Leucothrix arctica]PWQ93503.1 cell filamentation protein Fic [Leucothrix arctica]
MATPSEKLANSLEALHQLQTRGLVAIRSAELSRTHRERLIKNGFLEEVIKGWYVPARPDETLGESTAWYASFWQFCAAYLNHLKGENWCLSPEQSIALHTENMTVPKQLLVRAAKARNNVTMLPHGTSLLDIRAALPEPAQVIIKNGLRLYSLPAALIACNKHSFRQSPTDMRAALSMISDASEILEQLLEGGHSSIAGRLAGAFRNIGRNQTADDIVSTMQAVGYEVREVDPFEAKSSLRFSQREQSPYVNRIRLMWQDMRETVIAHFPAAPTQTIDKNAYMQHVEDVYITDAYHSLSIEGYRVTPELIDRVRAGDWDPEQNADDKERFNALAARGYWQAYQAVRNSITQILDGNNAGEVVGNDHRIWYREMFAPGVTAGIHKPADLAGYRTAPVFIRRSMHSPPSKEAVRDAMPAFFELLQAEENAAVRVVLGHFIFVYIHPYMDGNGRTGRFLMNAMLASGGYPWTVVPLEKRSEYMTALEEASTKQDIEPFATLLGTLVQAVLEGKAETPLPST